MKTRFLSLLLAALLPVSPVVLPEAALAQDSTLKALSTKNDARAWRAVGRINIANAGFCTGTLIAPDLVLTAAHCVIARSRPEVVAPSDVTFWAGLTDGAAAAQRQAAQIVVHELYDPTKPHTADNIRFDVALLRLDKAIPSHQIDPFVLHQGPVAPGSVSVVSYGQGRTEVLSRQRECNVIGTVDALIAMDCDVTFGSSGAPVFTHLNGRGRIAAIVSGGGTYSGQRVAFGMTLPEAVAGLKSRLRAEAPRPKAQVRRMGVGENKSGSGAKFLSAKGS